MLVAKKSYYFQRIFPPLIFYDILHISIRIIKKVSSEYNNEL